LAVCGEPFLDELQIPYFLEPKFLRPLRRARPACLLGGEYQNILNPQRQLTRPGSAQHGSGNTLFIPIRMLALDQEAKHAPAIEHTLDAFHRRLPPHDRDYGVIRNWNMTEVQWPFHAHLHNLSKAA
jgi:hypothetical protein